MLGLTVRWSLADAGPAALETLRRYVRDESFAGFAGRDGLRFKTWRAREGEWFEGQYVFATSSDREAFETAFRTIAETAPGTRLIGSAPVLIEPCHVVAVAEGGEGFAAAADYSD